MCRDCKGWGSLFTQQTYISYFGDGDEKERVDSGELRERQCENCKGTGYTGGKLRQGIPPVMQQHSDARKTTVDPSTGAVTDRPPDSPETVQVAVPDGELSV
jgi:hypothetical protein